MEPKRPHSDRQRYRCYLIFGPPGSGKGTQGKALGMLPRFVHFACGDIFRSLDTRTALGQAFLQYSSQGNLVPDELSIQLWNHQIDIAVESSVFKPDIDHLVLDGIPRNLKQAQLLEPLIEVKKVFYLHCADRKELVRRLKKRALKDNRLDDINESVIHKRLELYEEETRPVLEHYGFALVQTIDATQSPARVLYEILGTITGPGAAGQGNLAPMHHDDA